MLEIFQNIYKVINLLENLFLESKETSITSVAHRNSSCQAHQISCGAIIKYWNTSRCMPLHNIQVKPSS